MHLTHFRCLKCGSTYRHQEIERLAIPRCRRCGFVLDAEYNYDSIKGEILKDAFMRETPAHWKYHDFMPVHDLTKIITMGEGGTPLLENKRLSAKAGVRLLFKHEAANPTGSFKDRGSSLEVTKALEFKKSTVVVASTGNMGASIAAYAAFCGIACIVFIPDIVGSVKIDQIKAYGAEIKRIDGDYSNAIKSAEEYVLDHKDSFLTGDYPWRCEGTKTVGFEIADQLYWKVPDYVITPVGNGTLIWSIFEAFRELMIVGVTDRIPKMIGVQAEACSPVIDALKRDSGDIVPVIEPKTVASAIACGSPIDGHEALKAIRDSKGWGITVSDEQILAARDELGKNGIYVEPSGAVAYAGLREIDRTDMAGKTIVCLATGHGLKGI